MNIHSLSSTNGNDLFFAVFVCIVLTPDRFYAIIMVFYPETKWEDIENLLMYGVEHSMRLEAKDTPLFIANNSLISGGFNSNSGNDKSKAKVWQSYHHLIETPESTLL